MAKSERLSSSVTFLVHGLFVMSLVKIDLAAIQKSQAIHISSKTFYEILKTGDLQVVCSESFTGDATHLVGSRLH